MGVPAPLRRGLVGVFTLTTGLLVAASAGTSPLAAQGNGALDEWAHWVVAQRGQWKGQWVPFPAPEARPTDSPQRLCSELRPVCLHGPVDVEPAFLREALAELEAAYDLIDHGGWPHAFADGGRGGTWQQDVYLVDASPAAPLGHLEAPFLDGNLDGAITFATLPRTVAPDRLRACAVAALTEAALFGRDPAEAQGWRQATGAFVAMLATGDPGCVEASLVEQQQQPHRGWVTDAPETGAGAALLLMTLSDRLDGGTGTFVRELWQLTRQLTWHGSRLRGSPDFWEALDAALENAHEKLRTVIEDLAVARYFTRAGMTAPYPSLGGLPRDAVVPVTGPVVATQLPAHLHLGDPPIEVFGSAYALVDATGLDPMGRLTVWLRAELGVEWSLVAVRLRADGTETGRVVAPPRRDPRSFFPVELLGETDRVLLVVTNLGKGVPDADIEDTRAHGFSLIVDVDR